MKKVILLFLAISSFNSFAQTFSCGTTSGQIPPPNILGQQVSNTAISDPNEKYVINVFFHKVSDDNGNNDESFSNYATLFGEAQILDAVRMMNVNFNSHNIFFKYLGYDVIKNSTFNTQAQITPKPNFKPNTLNFYFVDAIGSNYGGLSIIGNTWAIYTYFSLENKFEQVFLHEVGHCLDLLHTFNMADECEHVVRSGPDYNAATSGDFVEDTPADPGPFGPTYFTNCIYNTVPSIVDCIGTPYQNIMPANFMGYTFIDCPPSFTEGQFQRMRNYLARPDSLMAIQFVNNTIESLYQSFEEKSVYGDIVSVTDNLPNDGMANVCRGFVGTNYRFQPGFSYDFSNIYDGSLISSNTVFQVPTLTAGFIQGIKINQVSTTTIREFGPACTRSLHCELEPYVGGRILTTSMIGNTAYTIEELDVIKVKDPDLYNSLISNTFNIVIKETVSGAKSEKVIYKN